MKRRRRPEQALQLAVAGYLWLVLRQPTYWTSIDHGVGKLGPVEAGLRKRRGVHAGIADVLIMHPMSVSAQDGTRVIWIELKTGKNKATEAQIDFRDQALACGCNVYVARSLEEVEQILEAEGIPLHAKILGRGVRVGE